jgi:hypothetical protein
VIIRLAATPNPFSRNAEGVRGGEIMHAIKGKYRDGKIILAETADWPEETEVLVEPIPREQTLGIREEDWPTDPEGIARLLALIDSIEPLEMTPEDEAEWQAALKAQREYELSKFEERARRLERMFE